MFEKDGSLIVLIGPSGSGKGTIISEVIAESERTFLSISATTRNPRPGEVDGSQYFFMSKESFEKAISDNEMLEYASYCDNFYGTPKAPVLERLERGENVILEIEMQGAKQIKEIYPNAVLIFIVPPSMHELAKRLRGRETESEEVISKRLDIAKNEVLYASQCDYIVVNDVIAQAVSDINTIIKANSHSRYIMRGFIEELQSNKL